RHTRSTRDWSSDVCSSDLHRLVPQPSEQPPQAARVHARVLIVGGHLNIARNAEPAEEARERAGVGQRMAAAAVCLGARQIVPEVRIHGSRDVPRAILSLTPRLVLQIVAT